VQYTGHFLVNILAISQYIAQSYYIYIYIYTYMYVWGRASTCMDTIPRGEYETA